jgi:hypothetical protein
MRQADYWQAGGFWPSWGGDAMSFCSEHWHLSIFAFASVAVHLGGDTAVGRQRRRQASPAAGPTLDRSVREHVERLLAEGMQTFRYNTFGSEDWGGQLKLLQEKGESQSLQR